MHCHSTFSLGGKEARAVRLMNSFGKNADHTILSAMPEALSARDALDSGVNVSFPGKAAPALHGKPGISRYHALSRYMAQFDLVLTYNWGSMDAVAARRIFAKGCPPLIHHEDGFNADEVGRLNWKRNAFRRLMLPAAHKVVVPSQRLESIAHDVWKQPSGRVQRISNGIPVNHYAIGPVAGSIPGFVRMPDDVVVGTLAGLREVKNLPRLVRAVAAQPGNVKLVIVGEGPERDEILAEAARCGMTDRLLMPGFLADPHRYIGHFDIFALSSDSEQFPISLVEAMAAGLPAVATDVGDVKRILSHSNQPYVVSVSDEDGFAEALSVLKSNATLRTELGSENRAFAVANYDEARMIADYTALYLSVLHPGGVKISA
ncbi:MAG: glycosyltransferase family 4 protein [Chakrabartia sp.]